MKKILTSVASALMLSCFAFAGTSEAQAQTPVVMGQEYTVSSMGSWSGSITIVQNGYLTITGTPSVFGDLTTVDGVELDGDFQYGDGNQSVVYSVEPGDYIYIIPWAGSNSTFSFSFSTEGSQKSVAVEGVYPAAGTAYNPVDYTDGVQVLFNIKNGDVTWGNVELVYVEGGQTVSIPVEGVMENGDPVVRYEGNALRAYINEAYEAILNAGNVKTCQVVFHDVAVNGKPVVESSVNGVTVADGTITINYNVEGAPALVNADIPNPFYASWPKGEKAGMGVLTFDQPIKSVTLAEVMTGEKIWGSEGGEDDNMAYVEIPFEISGNTVTLDFTGKNYNFDDSTVTVFVNGITGENGLMYRHKQDLYGTDFYSNTFTEYVDYVNEPYTEGGGETQGDLLSAVIPADNATISGFAEKSTIEFKFAEEPKAFTMELSINGEFIGRYYSAQGNDFVKNDEGYWVYTWGRPQELYKGETMEALFSTYANENDCLTASNPIATQTVSWKGDTESPESNVEVKSIMPEPYETITLAAGEAAEIKIEFTGPAKVTRVEIPVVGSITTYTGSDDNTVWTITIPYDMAVECAKAWDDLRATIYATDANGKPIYYESFAFMALQWNLDAEIIRGVDFDVDIEGMIVAPPVESFRISAGELSVRGNDYNVQMPDGTMINPYQMITITDAEGMVVSGVEPIAGVEGGEEAQNPFDGTVTLSNPITEPGTYTINFPYMAFNIGGYEEDVDDYSMPKSVEFTVDGKAQGGAWIYAPGEPGMTQISSMQVVWGDFKTLTPAGSKKIAAFLNIPNSDELIEVEGTPAWAEKDDENLGKEFAVLAEEEDEEEMEYNSINFKFPEVYTEVGFYTLTIPEDIVMVDGEANEAEVLMYEVKAPLVTMGEATLYDPESDFVNSCMSATLTWDFRKIRLSENADIMVMTDGENYLMDELTVQVTTVVPENQDGGVATAAEDVYGNALLIQLPDAAFSKTGVFTFVIPEGTVISEDGEVNAADEISIWVLPTTETDLTVTPTVENFGEVTVKTLEEITLNWDNMDVSTNTPCNIHFDNENGDQCYLDAEGLLDIEDGKTVVLTVASLTEEPGTYTLYIPEGSFLIGDETNLSLNGEYWLTFITTESTGIINVVDAQDGKYVVYNMNGVLVLSTEDGAALSQLQPGLYIINGKKILVTK